MSAPGARHYLVDVDVGPRPLYMCLGDPCGCEPVISIATTMVSTDSDGAVDASRGNFQDAERGILTAIVTPRTGPRL